MKAFLFDLVNKLQRASDTLDAKAILCNKTWRVFSDTDEKEVYIFMEDGKLVISVNGVAVIGSWMYIPANQSLVISGNNQDFLVHPIICNNVLALALDGSNKCCFLLDSTKQELDSIDSLKSIESYINKNANKMPFLPGTGTTGRRNVVRQKPIPSNALYATDKRLIRFEIRKWTDASHKSYTIEDELFCIKKVIIYKKITGTIYSSRHHAEWELIDGIIWRISLYYTNKQLAAEFEVKDNEVIDHYFDENGFELSDDDWRTRYGDFFESEVNEIDRIKEAGTEKPEAIDSILDFLDY